MSNTVLPSKLYYVNRHRCTLHKHETGMNLPTQQENRGHHYLHNLAAVDSPPMWNSLCQIFRSMVHKVMLHV